MLVPVVRHIRDRLELHKLSQGRSIYGLYDDACICPTVTEYNLVSRQQIICLSFTVFRSLLTAQLDQY